MTTAVIGRPTFAAIDTAALRANFAALRATVPPDVSVLPVVKANAYGHGATDLTMVDVTDDQHCRSRGLASDHSVRGAHRRRGRVPRIVQE